MSSNHPADTPVRMDYQAEALDLALDNLLVCVRNDEGMGDDMTAMDVRLALSKVRSLFAALRADTPVTEPEKTTGPGAWLRRVAGRFDRLFSLDHRPARDASEEYDEAFHDAVQALKDLRQFADIIAPTWRAASTLLQREPIAESCFECSGTGIADISSNAPFPCAVCGGLGKLSAERLREIDRAMGSGDGMNKDERKEFNDANRPYARHVKVIPADTSGAGAASDEEIQAEITRARFMAEIPNIPKLTDTNKLEGLLDELEKAVRDMRNWIVGETDGGAWLDVKGKRDAARSSIERWAAERTANDAFLSDVSALLVALGLGDHARPISAHAVVQSEILPAIARKRIEVEILRRDRFSMEVEFASECRKLRSELSTLRELQLTPEEAAAVYEAVEFLNYGYPQLHTGVEKLRLLQPKEGG